MAPPWIGPGRTSATCTVRSSRSLGQGAGQHLHLGAALDLKDAGRLGGADRLEGLGVVERDAREVDPLAAAPARSRRRSARPPRASPAPAGRSSGSRRRRRSPCPTGRSGGPAIAAGTTGQTSISGRVEITMPPGCWEAWRGRPIASPQSATSARQRGEAARSAPIAAPTWPSTSSASPWKPTVRATRSISPAGSPSALPRSRTAPRGR